MKISTGATIAFSTGFFAEILAISWSGIERESIETTHMGSTGGYKQFLPGNLSDPGELEVEMFLAPETIPPINGAAETVTVTLPSAGAGGTSTWSASGFMSGFEWEAPVEEAMKATGTIKLTGAITVVP